LNFENKKNTIIEYRSHIECFFFVDAVFNSRVCNANIKAKLCVYSLLRSWPSTTSAEGWCSIDCCLWMIYNSSLWFSVETLATRPELTLYWVSYMHVCCLVKWLHLAGTCGEHELTKFACRLNMFHCASKHPVAVEGLLIPCYSLS